MARPMDSAALKALRLFHRHEVIGIENIPKAGRALLVVNHSLATYDIGLLFSAISDRYNRQVRPLADNLFFKNRLLTEFIAQIGGVQGRSDEATTLLKNKQLVAVAPGGMREALRPKSQRYQLCWERRKGFVRLAIRTQTPILLAMCPRADDIFDVYDNPITPYIYKNFRMPFFLARGLGPTPIPRPVKLVHYIDTAITPPKPRKSIAEFERQVAELHLEVTERARHLMRTGIRE